MEQIFEDIEQVLLAMNNHDIKDAINMLEEVLLDLKLKHLVNPK